MLNITNLDQSINNTYNILFYSWGTIEWSSRGNYTLCNKLPRKLQCKIITVFSQSSLKFVELTKPMNKPVHMHTITIVYTYNNTIYTCVWRSHHCIQKFHATFEMGCLAAILLEQISTNWLSIKYVSEVFVCAMNNKIFLPSIDTLYIHTRTHARTRTHIHIHKRLNTHIYTHQTKHSLISLSRHIASATPGNFNISFHFLLRPLALLPSPLWMTQQAY